MPRSTETNQVIRAFFAAGFLMKLDDGEECYPVKDFDEAAAGVDSVDDSALIIIDSETKDSVGVVGITLWNKDEEQVYDWSSNDRINPVVEPIIFK